MLMTTTYRTIDQAEQELASIESVISRGRARQVEVLRELDRLQVCSTDGAGSLAEWTTGRLDVSPETGRALAYAARSESRALMADLETGTVSFDRAVATMRLANEGADAGTIKRARGLAVHHIRKLIARQRRMSTVGESDVFSARRFHAQPDLANTGWNLAGFLPAVDGELVFEALTRTGDTLSPASDPDRPTLPQRRADALVSLALDRMDVRPADPNARPSPAPRTGATVFIDATIAAKTRGQAGATTRHGLKVGPNTLQEILCEGIITVVQTDGNTLRSIGVGASAIPPRIRDKVWVRDGGCTIDGCTSTYRLEPHHIIEQQDGGNHELANLTLLCWHHHHVVIHQHKRSLDPASPPGRRRYLRRHETGRYSSGADPPGPSP